MDIERPDRLKRAKFFKRFWIALGTVTLIAAAIYVFTLNRPLPRVPRDEIWTAQVEKGNMLRNVRGLGRLVPRDLRWVSSRTSGRVEEKLVQSGTIVGPEDVLLKLSNPQLEQQYENARLELKAAEAELTSIRVRLKSELLAMRSAHTQLREQTEMAELDEEINTSLFADGLVSELNLKRSRLSAKHLRTRLEMETERLEFQEQAIEPQLATQQTQVDRARARLRLLQSQIDDLTVRAGSHGVVQQLEIEQGMQLVEGNQIALVADLSTLKGVIAIQESQAREIRLGQTALVDTRTSGKVDAIVSRIDPNVERGVVQVDLEFPDGLPEGCRADQTVQGVIELERLENVVYVDRPTIAREFTSASVFRLQPTGNRADRVTVEFGRSSVTLIEVVGGLAPGDTIILSDTSRWQTADAIEIR